MKNRKVILNWLTIIVASIELSGVESASGENTASTVDVVMAIKNIPDGATIAPAD